MRTSVTQDLEQRTAGRGRTATVYDCSPGRVLKLFRAGWPRQELAFEAVASAVAARRFAGAPRLDAVVELDGRLGLIYERAHGLTMLAALPQRPWRVPALARQLAALHAAMHRQSGQPLPAYQERLVRQIQRAHVSGMLPEALRDQALAVLAALPDGDRLCHGDFHPDNVVLAARGPVVIDWLTAAAGHPLADVARTHYLLTSAAMPAFMPVVQRVLSSVVRRAFASIYLRHYASLAGYARPSLEAQLAAWRVPIAAARLAEGIDEETASILRLLHAA